MVWALFLLDRTAQLFPHRGFYVLVNFCVGLLDSLGVFSAISPLNSLDFLSMDVDIEVVKLVPRALITPESLEEWVFHVHSEHVLKVT